MKGNKDMNISKLSMYSPSFRAGLWEKDFKKMVNSARDYVVESNSQPLIDQYNNDMKTITYLFSDQILSLDDDKPGEVCLSQDSYEDCVNVIARMQLPPKRICKIDISKKDGKTCLANFHIIAEALKALAGK